MITRDDMAVSNVFIGDRVVSSIYCCDNLIWQPWSTDNLWVNTYVSKQFLNVNGQAAISTNGDRYEVYTGQAHAGDMFKFEWIETIVGVDGNSPSVRVCFFNNAGRFIPPRFDTVVSQRGSHSYIVTAPESAVRIDVRIDDPSSTRRQQFVDFKMYKN